MSIKAEMFCLQCGYNLRGLERPSCPECGRGYDAENPATYRRPVKVSNAVRNVALILVIVAGALDIFALIGVLIVEFPLPLMCGFGAFILSLIASIIGLVHLVRVRGKNPTVWLILLAAFVAGIGGIQMMGWAVDTLNAINAV